MSSKVALIAPEHLLEYFRTLDYSSLDCEISFLSYQNRRQLPELYEKIERDFDGFCTTGIIARELLLRFRRKDDEKPIQSIMVRSTECYKEFLRLINENREIDFSRVYLDFSLVFEGGKKTVQDHIGTRFNVEKQREAVFQEVPTEALLTYSQRISERALQLWEDKKLDLLISRDSEAIPTLERWSIPHSFVYPEWDNVLDALTLLTKQIKIGKINQTLPAMVFVSLPTTRSVFSQGINLAETELQRGLLEFDQNHRTGFLMQKAGSGFELYSSRGVIQRITKNFTDCLLARELRERYGMEIRVGYGIGSEMIEARNNSYEAYQKAQRNNGSYLIDENHVMIGPMSTGAGLNVPETLTEQIRQAAKQSGLSVLTVQRIQAVTKLRNSKEVTARELAETLQVTVVNSSRFLAALEKGGVAHVAGMRKSLSKGRPSRVYHIDL